jgi:hypothetical protein
MVFGFARNSKAAHHVAAIFESLRRALHAGGVPAMNYRLLLQSVVFVLEGLLLVLLLSAALHFEAARLVFGIAVAVFCLMVEIFVAVRIAQRLWRWSGQLARLVIRENSGTSVPTATATGTRGEA